MGKAVRRAAVALMATALVGCGGEVLEGWNQSLDPGQPVVLEQGMVYLDQDFDELIVLRPTLEDNEPMIHAHREATAAGATQMVASIDGKQLFVLNDRARSLSIFDVGAEEVERVDLALDTNYDVINVDPYGDYLVLSNSGQRRAGTIVQNLNEVAIVDLRSQEPTVRFLSLVTRAQNLEFMPPFTLGGVDQRMVVALADSQITLIDLMAEAVQDQQRRIPLTISQADQVRRPTQVVYDIHTSAGGTERVSLFVLNDRDNDISEIVIQPSIREDQITKFDLSVNQLAAGSRPGRIAMVETPQGRRLLALDSIQPRFTLVDVLSGESATFPLRQGTPVTEMIPYHVQVPGQDELEPRVLVYSPQSSLVSVIRPNAIALGTETPTTGQAVQDIRLTTAAPTRIVMDERSDSNRAIALHSGGNDGFTLLNLVTHTEAPIQGFPLTDVVFDGSQAFGIFGNTPHLVRIDLAGSYAREIALPFRARALHLSPDRQTLLVRHEGSSGRFTILPVAEPTAEKSRFFEHVFLRGLFDRPAYAGE